jgi:hypothetical protein
MIACSHLKSFKNRAIAKGMTNSGTVFPRIAIGCTTAPRKSASVED